MIKDQNERLQVLLKLRRQFAGELADMTYRITDVLTDLTDHSMPIGLTFTAAADNARTHFTAVVDLLERVTAVTEPEPPRTKEDIEPERDQ